MPTVWTIGYERLLPPALVAELAVESDFAIRPEDLNYQQPSRLNVQQTFGGAWADSYGAGLRTISMSGHTGWRGSLTMNGEDLFYALRDTVMTGWHSRREAAARNGIDPADVRLSFVDTLDDFSGTVAPRSFTLRRSRASPLLMRYQLQLVVLDDGNDATTVVDSNVSALSNPLRWLAGVTGLGNLLGTLESTIGDVRRVFGVISEAPGRLIAIVRNGIDTVQGVARDARGIFDGPNAALHALMSDLTLASRNGFGVLARSPDLTDSQRGVAMAAASQSADAHCTLANSFTVGRYFRSYEELFGASLCSSTAGGRPWSTFAEQDQSGLAALFPPVASRVSIDQGGRDALAALRRDPLTLDPAQVPGLMAAAADGIAIR